MSPRVRVTGSRAAAGRRAARRPRDLVVCVAAGAPADATDVAAGAPAGATDVASGAPRAAAEVAAIDVRVGGALGPKLRRAIRAALAPFEGPAPPAPRPVRAGSPRAVARRAGEVAGAVVVVRVTERNARRLPATVEAAWAAGCAAVQIVWDGESPAPELAEAPVFASLEAARAAPERPPVVLTPGARAPAALGLAIAARARGAR